MIGVKSTTSLFILLIVIQEMSSQPMIDFSKPHPKQPHECGDYPEQADSNNKNTVQKKKLINKDAKKDIFVSRGWGAGGMPFNVLYMNPVYSSKPPMPEALALTDVREGAKHTPQVRTRMPKNVKHKSIKAAKPRSAIPHLFVSYGWGPLGKK